MEIISANNSCDWKNLIDSISILLVDDDTTCLSIVAAALKKLKYQVVTVNHPNDALCTLRMKGGAGAFDLVISDVHMPDMNGFELQQAIAQEFNLPVVLMSADDKEGTALKGLESGTAFFILKPVSADDLRDLWQFAARKKTSTQVVIDESGSNFPSFGQNNISDEIALTATSVNEDRVNKKDSKRKSPNEKTGENSQSASHKKPKVIWTNSLQNRFLEAIRTIGLDRVVPKKILEVMNVPGLTRENVASHLQKYRIFLRRVTEASYTIQNCGDQNGLSTNFMRSNCESSSRIISNPPSTSQTPNTFNYQNPRQFPSLNPNFASLPNTNRVPQSRLFGQSELLSNEGSLVKPNIGNSNLLSRQNNYQTRPIIPFHGHFSYASHSQNPSTTMSSPPNNFTYPTNYVGYSTIANLKHHTNSGDTEKYKGDLNLCGGITNFPNENRVYNVDDQLGQHVEASNPFVANNNGGEQLGDVISDYRMLPPDGGNDESGFIPSCDLSEFDFLDDADFQTTLPDQVNIQNQAQQNGNEATTSSNLYGEMSHRDNLVSSFDHAANQRDDDDLLEALLAPFREDHPFEGI